MSRRNKQAKPKDSRRAKTFELPPVKFIAAAVSIIAVLVITAFLGRMFYRPGYFNVSSVKVVWHDDAELASVYKYDKLYKTGIGQNIFKPDLKKLSSEIMSRYPVFKNCVVKRRLPGELVLEIYMRQPVAQILHGRFYLIDKDAILLYGGDKSTAYLPIISGLSWMPLEKAGEKISSNKLKKVLNLLDTIKKSGILKDHRLSRIDVTDAKNMLFFIDNNLEVRIGDERFPERIGLLKEVLYSDYVNKDDLAYIDLRFDDIIFGAK